MPARSVCLVWYGMVVTLSLSEAGPGRFGRQVSDTDIYHTIPYHTSPLGSVSPAACSKYTLIEFFGQGMQRGCGSGQSRKACSVGATEGKVSRDTAWVLQCSRVQQ